AGENTIVAGNTTIDGGRAGLRVRRFRGVDLRRTLIVANNVGGAAGREGGVISVMENNVIADNGTPREKGKKVAKAPPKPAFRVTREITARKFDAGRYVTEITTNEALGKEDLAGSVVRIGDQWSVVRSRGASGLII